MDILARMSKSLEGFLQSVKPNTIPKVLAWLITLKPILQYIFDVINAVSNLDFAISARGNPRMIAIWNFLVSPLGNLFFSALGFAWLTFFAWRQSNKSQMPTLPKTASSGGIEGLEEQLTKLRDSKQKLED